MRISLVHRKRQVAERITRDPWTCTLTHNSRGIPGTTPASWTFIATVQSSGPYAGIDQWSRRLPADVGIGVINFCLLAPFNTEVPKTGDSLKAVHVESGVTSTFRVISGYGYPYKVEATLAQVQ